MLAPGHGRVIRYQTRTCPSRHCRSSSLTRKANSRQAELHGRRHARTSAQSSARCCGFSRRRGVYDLGPWSRPKGGPQAVFPDVHVRPSRHSISGKLIRVVAEQSTATRIRMIDRRHGSAALANRAPTIPSVSETLAGLRISPPGTASYAPDRDRREADHHQRSGTRIHPQLAQVT